MDNRLTPADSARIKIGIESEKEVLALIDLVLDQSLPRDIRRSAGDRLNDLSQETLNFLRLSNNRTLLAKVARCGFVAAKFQAFAKSGETRTEPKPIAIENNSGKLRLIAALEAQNELLRQAIAKRGQLAIQLPKRSDAQALPF
jgi:hypothetical protein